MIIGEFGMSIIEDMLSTVKISPSGVLNNVQAIILLAPTSNTHRIQNEWIPFVLSALNYFPVDCGKKKWVHTKSVKFSYKAYPKDIRQLDVFIDSNTLEIQREDDPFDDFVDGKLSYDDIKTTYTEATALNVFNISSECSKAYKEWDAFWNSTQLIGGTHPTPCAAIMKAFRAACLDENQILLDYGCGQGFVMKTASVITKSTVMGVDYECFDQIQTKFKEENKIVS
jgi:hypothetical protein